MAYRLDDKRFRCQLVFNARSINKNAYYRRTLDRSCPKHAHFVTTSLDLTAFDCTVEGSNLAHCLTSFRAWHIGKTKVAHLNT